MQLSSLKVVVVGGGRSFSCCLPMPANDQAPLINACFSCDNLCGGLLHVQKYGLTHISYGPA